MFGFFREGGLDHEQMEDCVVCSGHVLVLWLFLIIMWYFCIEGCVNDWSTGDLTRGREVTDRDG